MTEQEILVHVKAMQEEGMVSLTTDIENTILIDNIEIIQQGSNQFTMLMESLIDYLNYSDSIKQFLKKIQTDN